jgi:hypothetical protein
MSERLRRAFHEAAHGDLRPQFNSASPAWPSSDLDKALEPILLDRLLQLSRPIADASTGPHPDMRLSDAASFFYLLETLKRLDCRRLEETLGILLDEFLQLEERSYDELYLWCLVELSRTRSAHVRTYWPQVFSLDLLHRSAAWQRPKGVALVDQPYRLTDLLFYYYVLGTLHLQVPPTDFMGRPRVRQGYVPLTLARCLASIAGELTEAQLELVRRALKELALLEKRRPAFGDALGLLSQPERLQREQQRLEQGS